MAAHLRHASLACIFLLAVLLPTACGSNTDHGEGGPLSADVLRAGTEGTYSPFSYHDAATGQVTGQLTGYDVDVAKAVADKLGVRGETLIVTHEIQFAKQVSSQVLFTDQGVILEQGPPERVIGDPEHERTRQFLQRVLNPL